MNQSFPAVKQDFSIVRVVASSSPIDAIGISQIQLYISAGVYHRMSRIIFTQSYHQTANEERRVLMRNDCFPIRAATLTLDGQTILQAAFLQQLQYAYWQKFLSKKNCDVHVTGDLAPGEISLQPVCIGVAQAGAQQVPCNMSFTLSHFFPFLFDESSDYIVIKNQLSCTMTVDNQRMFFYQVSNTPKSSLITAATNPAGYPLQCTCLLRVPNFQVDASLLPQKIHTICQYATNGNQSSIFSYTPQQQGVVSQIILGFGEAIGEAGYNSITATHTPKTNLVTNKTTLNGLSIIYTEATNYLDLANQMAVLAGHSTNDSGSHCVIDSLFMNSNIQLQIAPGANVQTLVAFVELLPLM